MRNKPCTGPHGPLKKFQTENEARSFIFENGMENTSPYKCPNCDKFHLSPKDRVTPSKHCAACDKELYADKAAAERRADIIAEEREIRISTYRCKVSKGWHLTSQ